MPSYQKHIRYSNNACLKVIESNQKTQNLKELNAEEEWTEGQGG